MTGKADSPMKAKPPVPEERAPPSWRASSLLAWTAMIKKLPLASNATVARLRRRWRAQPRTPSADKESGLETRGCGEASETKPPRPRSRRSAAKRRRQKRPPRPNCPACPARFRPARARPENSPPPPSRPGAARLLPGRLELPTRCPVPTIRGPDDWFAPAAPATSPPRR